MVQFRVIDRRRSEREILDQFQSFELKVQKGVLRAMATRIAEMSEETEDTGTYAESHQIALRSGSFSASITSRGKTRGGTGGKASQRGLRAMLGDIERLQSGSNNLVFRNLAFHAFAVERKGWPGKQPYRIYSRVQREASSIITRVVESIRAGGT